MKTTVILWLLWMMLSFPAISQTITLPTGTVRELTLRADREPLLQHQNQLRQRHIQLLEHRLSTGDSLIVNLRQQLVLLRLEGQWRTDARTQQVQHLEGELRRLKRNRLLERGAAGLLLLLSLL